MLVPCEIDYTQVCDDHQHLDFVCFVFQFCKSDIDFFTEHYEQLKFMEEMGTYPPRFSVVISCTATAHLHHARIEFRGAVNELVFDVPLYPPHPPQAAPTSPSRSSIGTYIII